MGAHVDFAQDGDRTGAGIDMTVFDGTNYIVILTANWRGGLWRFVE